MAITRDLRQTPAVEPRPGISDFSREHRRMKTYLDIVRQLPRPTAAQVNGFVEYVCDAHSWYKHIPLMPPGTEFCFFQHPYAACERVSSRSGRLEFRERTERGFHYNQWPTIKYREHCGFLDYLHGPSSVPAIYLLEGENAEAQSGSLMEPRRKEEQQRVLAPPEILDAGRVRLTSVIHPLASQPGVWLWMRNSPRLSRADWPTETGGRETLEKILAVAQRWADRNFERQKEIWAEIEQLIAPERARQRALMVKAIEKMLRLVYEQEQSAGGIRNEDRE